jgi:hypothetical protein
LKLKDFILGLIFVPVGILIMLFFSFYDDSTIYRVLRWIGVALMIGGPLLFWELIPMWKEKEWRG